MYIYSIQDNNRNISFTQFFMPTQAKMAKSVGHRLAKSVEAQRNWLKHYSSQLEGIANVHVKPIKDSNIERRGFKITIKPPMPNTKNPFKRLLYWFNPGLTIEETHNICSTSSGESLLCDVERLINEYQNFLKGITLQKELGKQFVMPSYEDMKSLFGPSVAKVFESARLPIGEMVKRNDVVVNVEISSRDLFSSKTDYRYYIAVSSKEHTNSPKGSFVTDSWTDLGNSTSKIIERTQALIDKLRDFGEIN